ncbi:unnamed protein product [Larinioides sclopetarius]|uniref:IGFBP N-terminal domain-containing protein n=2 Tax=Larinioides sclopetarius TaxID=280406 RepID=A0AAV1ZKL7_9ARAC
MISVIIQGQIINMRATFCIVVCFGLVMSCLALDCPDCDIKACRNPGLCRLGKTTDVCGCCPVCYKGVGDECGGPWNVFGVCAHHLSCVRLPGPKGRDPITEFNNKGRCLALP